MSVCVGVACVCIRVCTHVWLCLLMFECVRLCAFVCGCCVCVCFRWLCIVCGCLCLSVFVGI